MKNFLRILFLVFGVIILHACAKPTVVNVTMPGDDKLDCEQLEDGFIETRRFKKEAENMRDPGTGGNVTRTIFFWPALVQSMHNADEAIRAADGRAYHLVNIMRNKNCDDADKLFLELTKKVYPVYLSLEIKRLNKLYKKGVLTEEEFIQAKKKVLAQFE